MLQGLQVVVQGLRHPFQALAGSVAHAVSHGRTSEISAAAQRLYLRPVVLRTAAELARRHPGALAALNVAAVQDGRDSAVARLARDLLQHGYVEPAARAAADYYQLGLAAGLHPSALAAPLAAGSVQAASADALAALFSMLYHRGQEELLVRVQVAAAQRLGRADVVAQVAWALVRRGAQHVVVHLNARLIECGEYAAAADIAESFYATGNHLAASRVLASTLTDAAASASTRAGAVELSWLLAERGRLGLVQDAFAALVQDLRRPRAAGRLSWAAIQEGRAALVEALAVRLLQQEQLCHGRGCTQVAAELAQATCDRAAGEPGGEQHASRVLARALVAAVGTGCKAAVAELQLVLWRRRQLALLRDTLAGMVEEGEAGVRAAAEVAWLLIRTGEGAAVGDVQAAMVLEGLAEPAARVLEALYDLSRGSPHAVQVASESVLAALRGGGAPHVVTLMEHLLGHDPPGGALHDTVVVWLTDRGYVSPFVRVGTAVALGGRGTLLRLLVGRRLRAAAQGSVAVQGHSSGGEAPGTAAGLAPWAESNRQEDWSLP